MAGFARLSAQDSSFLVFEEASTPMNVGGCILLEAGSLARPDGGADIERIRRHFVSRLHWIPRYRQRLIHAPLTGHPYWTDDESFDIERHVRHTALPRPGSDAQLAELAGRILAQPLDRTRPLWETWVVEGLEGGRFALIIKTHHCVVDGVSGVDLLAALLQPAPQQHVDPIEPWTPEPPPDQAELIRCEIAHRLSFFAGLEGAAREALRDPARSAVEIGEKVSAAAEWLTSGLTRPDPTPLNGPIGPHRRFAWTEIDLAAVKEVKQRLGGSVNDVVLATVTGALQRFCDARGVDLRNRHVRAVVPVSLRAATEHEMGNRVSAWLPELPVDEVDARRRYQRIRATTAHLKDSRQVRGAEALAALTEHTDLLLNLGVHVTRRLQPYNLLVTNVPGPPVPMYLLGSRMLAGFPLVPLFADQGLAIALLSYAGRLLWGFNADWDRVPDLDRFVHAVRESFHELSAAARHEKGSRGPRPRGKGTTAGRGRTTPPRRARAARHKGSPKRR